MKQLFTVKKVKSYIELTYHGYKLNGGFDLYYPTTVWVNNREQAVKFMLYIRSLENTLGDLIEEQDSYNHNPRKILATYFKVLEAVCDGLDVRAKWSYDKLAQYLLNCYNVKYWGSKKLCEHIKSKVRIGKTHYMDNYTEFDLYERLRKEFEFDMPKMDSITITMSDELDALNEKTDELLGLVKKDGK